MRGLFTMTKKSPCSIQALYDLYEQTFTPSATSSPSSQAIHKLYSLLDTISPEDVGLKDESLEDERGHGLFGLNVFNRVDSWAQPIIYVDIHEGQNFSLSCCKPPSNCGLEFRNATYWTMPKAGPAVADDDCKIEAMYRAISASIVNHVRQHSMTTSRKIGICIPSSTL